MYWVILKKGTYQRGTREFHGQENLSMSDDDARHFIGMGLVTDSDHPEFLRIYRKVKTTPSVPVSYIDQKIDPKAEEAEARFGQKHYRSLETFARANKYDIEWLRGIGAEGWFQ